MLRDRGHSSDASLTFFDGVSGLSAPAEVQHLEDTFPGTKFTLATWMRHRQQEERDKHEKEHIVCRADDHSECS